MSKKNTFTLKELEKLHDKVTQGNPSLNESINILKKVLSVKKDIDKTVFCKKSQIKIVKEVEDDKFDLFDFKEA